MQSITLSPSAAIVGTVLLLGLAASDGWLTYSVHRQQAALDTFANQQALTLPKIGQNLPTLAGHKLTTGEDFSVIPVSTKYMTLLVYREGCHYCEQNWKNWESLFETSSNTMPVVFITGDTAVSSVYQQKHPMLSHHISLVGVKPELLASLKLNATPQTVLVVDGNVKKDWAGVLNDDDLKEVKQAVGDEIARYD